MAAKTGSTRIVNGRLIDGNGSKPQADAAVLVAGERIAYAGPASLAPRPDPGERVIDARGGTIMPGLVEAHWHATYFDVAELADLDVKYPVEYVSLIAAANARLALSCGYTAARSCGSLHNIDVWLKRAIEKGLTDGPRLATSGREICGSGGLMDWNPAYLQLGMEGLILLVDGPVEARAAARKLVKDGVEWIKTYPTGDAASPRANHKAVCMTFDEVKAVADEAHNYGVKVTGHCRAREGILNAVRAGFDTIEHATFADQESVDLIVARGVGVVPGLRFEQASVERGKAFGHPQWLIDGHQETLDAGVESLRRLHRAGAKLALGGDFGFAWNPHGEYAKELTFCVRDAGLPTLDVLRYATRGGAELMGCADQFGTLAPGKLADILVVDGDVVADIALLEDRSRFIAVMQGGAVKAGSATAAAPLQLAAARA